jgi:hypothetical protein
LAKKNSPFRVLQMNPVGGERVHDKGDRTAITRLSK